MNNEFIRKYISCFYFKEYGRMEHLIEFGGAFHGIYKDTDKNYEKVKNMSYSLEGIFDLLIDSEEEDVNEAYNVIKEYLKYTKTHSIFHKEYAIKSISKNFIDTLTGECEFKSPEVKDFPVHLKELEELTGKKIMKEFINLEIKFLENVIKACDEDSVTVFKNFKNILESVEEFYNDSNYYATIKSLGEYLGKIELRDFIFDNNSEYCEIYKNIEFTIDYVIHEFVKEAYSEIE